MKKLSRKKYDKLVDECIENFDFAKVQSVMCFLNQSNSLGIPNEAQMVGAILDKAETVWNLMQENKKKTLVSSTSGGFTLTHYLGMITLTFAVAEYDAYGYKKDKCNVEYKSLKEIMGFSDEDLEEFLNLTNSNDE